MDIYCLDPRSFPLTFSDDDSDSEFQDGEDADFDLFGRLEESRAQLEEALGADKLIQVYKTVQVCITQNTWSGCCIPYQLDKLMFSVRGVGTLQLRII